jgi:hypothetical protein
MQRSIGTGWQIAFKHGYNRSALVAHTEGGVDTTVGIFDEQVPGS